MISETVRKGEIGCFKVGLACLEKGAEFCRPSVDSAKYDAIIDYEGKLYRAQIKYADAAANHSQGAVWVNFFNAKDKEKYKLDKYLDGVDSLLVYVPKIDAVLWFDAKDLKKKTSLHIRLKPPKNNQKKGITLAEDYVWHQF